ncbi:MAG: putative O-glycosylation ligase, exosortase A system-associated [bacterium]|nr:putative O-glycosylation ligase, exosortase A system-associated [bacterium]
MRDIVLIAILPFLIYAIFQRPFIGLGLWIWTALFYPNGWVYGIAGTIRYNLIFAGLTICMYYIKKEKSRLQLGSVGVLVLIFILWTLLTTLFAIASQEVAWEWWFKLAKITTLFIFILLIINKKLHIDFFLWCLILSVGFFSGLEGLKYVASGGGHHIEGMAKHVLGDRNELAVAMAMLLPICFYLLGEFGKKSWIIKSGLIGLITLLIVAIIGTNSRGGLIALISVGGYLFIKSKRKFLFALLFVCIGGAMIGLIPEEWFTRMNSISQAEGDASFMGRVVAWKLSFILALQHPIFGGGFKAIENFSVWSALSQDFSNYPFFYTGTAVPDPRTFHAAHSIYFQVLGDHGFVGFFIFVTILTLSFFKAGRIAKKAKEAKSPEWLINLATMLQLSIFTFAVGGAALSFAYFDMIYAIFAIVVVLENKLLPSITNIKKTV